MPDQTLTVGVGEDHVKNLAKNTRPIRALEELVWNALDADADEISIELYRNASDGLEEIIVSDDGGGIDRATLDVSFGFIGQSLKRGHAVTSKSRTVHGKEGKGRFCAFSLGDRVLWTSRYEDAASGEFYDWGISGDTARPKDFIIKDPVKAIGGNLKPGCRVSITNLRSSSDTLLKESARNELTARLAIHLNKYSQIAVIYDGVRLDPQSLQTHSENYSIQSTDDASITGDLTVVEWKFPAERRLYICTSNGHARCELPPYVQAGDFQYTAYLKTSLLDDIDDPSGDLTEIVPGVGGLIDAAKGQLKTHFKNRGTAQRQTLVERWKQEGIYPYQTAAASPVEQVERDVFEMCAISVHDGIANFEKSDIANKKLTLRLLRQALELSPTDLNTILGEVLSLSKERQAELAQLLRRTKFENIIKASNIITSRLAFLTALEVMLYEDTYRQRIKERAHIHNILINELWIFGEEYTLAHSDQGLAHLLESHTRILGRPALVGGAVPDINGNESRPDIMVSCRQPESRQGEFLHLVIEIKRPRVVIGQEEIGQIKRYAYTISNDRRFDKNKTKWKFILMGDDMDAYASQECDQNNRQYGHIDSKQNLDVWLMKWSTLIGECRWRYEFYRQALDYQATSADGIEYLREKYNQFLPSNLARPTPLPAPATATSLPPADRRRRRGGTAP